MKIRLELGGDLLLYFLNLFGPSNSCLQGSWEDLETSLGLRSDPLRSPLSAFHISEGVSRAWFVPLVTASSW